MTRRVVAAMIGLTVLLLAGVVVPLGLAAARNDRQVFADRTAAAATAVATAAEERLADPASGPLLLPALARDDAYAVYDGRGRLVTGRPGLAEPADLSGALAGRSTTRWTGAGEGAVTAVVPVANGPQVIGAAALRREAGSVDRKVVTLWGGLAAAALSALGLAALLAIALGRWAGAPLRRLDAAAARLGHGELTERVGPSTGPPEVRQLAATFDEMADRLQTLVVGHRALVADVSHQLRTPLAAMRLRLELLRDDVAGPAAEELSGTLAEVNRLSRMVDGLLAVARAEHAASNPEPLLAADALEERVAAWRPVAAEKDVRLVVAVTGQPVVAVTPGHLEQVLDNLLANALEATPSGGTVTVSAAAAGPRVRLRVADTGPGMTAEQRSHAFHRFAGTSTGGSGLGLAIVARLVAVDGGSVSLDQADGGGLVLTVELPAAR